MPTVLGLHHVTAIASDPQRNLDFYAGVLGLRLVKRTVNFDDPGSYHFYFGDEAGTPGSILTFFPWPDAEKGRVGTGQVAITSFAIQRDATAFWIERLLRYSIAWQGPVRRMAPGGATEHVISFRDPDGLMLELVAGSAPDPRTGWQTADVPLERTIRGLHSVTLWVEQGDPTEQVLRDTLGFHLLGEDGSTRRYTIGDRGPGAIVDVRSVGGFVSGVGGVGTVHHVAWGTASDAEELALRERILRAGLEPTPVVDRTYFRSVYFREPGGVLFEIATVSPGFTLDEPLERLGEQLMLPAQFASGRAEIEGALMPVRLPSTKETVLPFSRPESSGDAHKGFVHRYVRPDRGDQTGAGATTLLLLHGTGGDEKILLPLGDALLPGAGMLSPRGQVLERGAPRFFRRLAEGVFDQEDLAHRTDELAAFIDGAAATYGFARDSVVAVGFSNGANIAASLLLRRPGALRAAVLLSPMTPFEPDVLPDLAGRAVFIGAGRADPVVPVAQVERLAELLSQAGAEVSVHWEPGGHEITQNEIDAARQWVIARATSASASTEPLRSDL